MALQALLISLKVAFCATIINLLLGVGTGYIFARKRFIGREVLDTIFTLPMVLPPTVLGYYLLVLLGKQSTLGLFLKNTFGINLIFTWQAAVIASVVVTFPLVFKAARSSFASVDVQLEQAARVLALAEWAIFIRVTLPLAWPGILAGVLLAFARALGEFGATLIVAGSIKGKTQTLSIAIYEALQSGQDQVAHTLVIVISVVCIAVLLVTKYLSNLSTSI